MTYIGIPSYVTVGEIMGIQKVLLKAWGFRYINLFVYIYL